MAGAPADCCNLVATEVNGDSKRINEKGSILGSFVGLVVTVQEIFVLPWLL